LTYKTINPATGQHVETFPEHTPEEIERALQHAHAAYVVWRGQSIDYRARLLRKVADLMRERVERLPALITLEMGKLIEESRGETMLSADILTYYADNAENF
jgi:succinate-semialdehyde dehydrogenase / glutarate-semialdehyde dehydrogenase